MRGVLLGLAALLAAAAGGLAGCSRQAEQAAVSSVRIGGPFQLIDTDGRPVTEKALLGKPSVIFFGFTYCPEVCPTTLAQLTAAMQALGPGADRLNVVFITLDPERDTPAQLKLYLSNFDRRIRGFTGTAHAIDAAAKAYRVYHQKVPTEGGGYTVDHSSVVLLFDKRGRFVEPLGYGAPPERVLAQLKALARG